MNSGSCFAFCVDITIIYVDKMVFFVDKIESAIFNI